MVLPLNISRIHASALLMPEKPIAELRPFCLNGIELRSGGCCDLYTWFSE
jgi:hypothetical protein